MKSVTPQLQAVEAGEEEGARQAVTSPAASTLPEDRPGRPPANVALKDPRPFTSRSVH